MIVKAVGVALILTLMAVLLRSFGFKGAGVFAAFSLTVLLSFFVGEWAALSELFGYAATLDGEGAEYVGAIVKIIGVGYIFGISADICRELGEGGISSGVVLVGRAEMVAIALPYFKRILDIGTELLQ